MLKIIAKTIFLSFSPKVLL